MMSRDDVTHVYKLVVSLFGLDVNKVVFSSCQFTGEVKQGLLLKWECFILSNFVLTNKLTSQ